MRLLRLVPLAVLSACATMIEGTTGNVTVSTTPAGATCVIDREGQRIGTVAMTPGSLSISKSRHDLTVACSKEGYDSSSISIAGGFTGTTFGNILAGGIIGVAVDAASAANSKYPQVIRLDLVEHPRPAAAPLYGQQASSVMPIIYEPGVSPGS
ncbi:PEGA domain-containing protein [Roseomonas sp. M0104]|uniref:PEGA domain-containing protein n=1 Tax=Teichococcus coralli TaxID=2545983 RepID=A0A845BE04_9PROT|nr:PEGA domain-containing protein [Pseudoroseomonas coralli]MXP65155.1 PEGA domain-containing protein [Pseudoroseomonas coralli]